MEGTLIEDIKNQAGDGGFGYDPIVFLPQYGKTVAQLSAEEKPSDVRWPPAAL